MGLCCADFGYRIPVGGTTVSLSRRVLVLLAVCAVAASSVLVSAPGTAAATPAKPGDYNGDGYPDLAVGAPNATVNGFQGAGAVAIVYGTANGLDTAKRQRLQQGISWVPGALAAEEGFGNFNASADLNGDGYSDLAICAPNEKRSGSDKGTLMLTFGSANGLNRGYQLLPSVANPGYCGGVVAGDFDADGYPDLAVRSGRAVHGPIEIIAGGPDTGFRSKLVRTTIMPSSAVGQLGAGDVTGDGFADLVVGAPDENPTGGLTLYKGSAAGLAATPAQTVRTPGSYNTAVGDVNGDGFDDVAAANTFVGPSGVRFSGLVRLWYGSRTGLDTARGFTLITQETPGVPDAAEYNDRFGEALEIGDADGDGHAELAIGSIESIGTGANGREAGTITVIYGSAGGLDFGRVSLFSQDTPGIPDLAEAEDHFGGGMLFRDFDLVADGRADLVAAASEAGTTYAEGAVFVLESTATGLSAQGATMFGPQQVGIAPARAYFGTLG
jgi:FG-GAP repeat protein/VCBS repeat protein